MREGADVGSQPTHSDLIASHTTFIRREVPGCWRADGGTDGLPESEQICL